MTGTRQIIPPPDTQPEFKSYLGHSWCLQIPAPRRVKKIEQETGLEEMAASLLALRIDDKQIPEDFVTPTMRKWLPDPDTLCGVNEAIERLMQAIRGQEKIALIGDYDVDGACSIALLSCYLSNFDMPCPSIYVPDRLGEGYGPNETIFQKIADENITLVLVLDCGTVSFGPLDFARTKGLEVIVVDHHIADATLPAALAVVNPNRLDDTSGLGHLAAAGVVFMVLVALNRRVREEGFFEAKPEPSLMALLDLVALATVCDAMPLIGLNRAFVRQGLKIMARRERKALVLLCDRANLKAPPTEYDLGFILGPRLNAAGRLEDGALAALFLAGETEAEKTVEKLEELNKIRRETEQNCYQEAIQQIEQAGDTLPPVLYVEGEGWHFGVIGIIASRLVRRYQRPACVVGFNATESGRGSGRGSGRSISGVDLGGAIIEARQRGLLEKGGGHKMAAGFSITKEKREEFCLFLHEHMKTPVEKALAGKFLSIDAVIPARAFKPHLVETLAALRPFGLGNVEPRFVLRHMVIAHHMAFGHEGRHWRLRLEDAEGTQIEAVLFNVIESGLEPLLNAHQDGTPLHFAGKMKSDIWKGRLKISFKIEDASADDILMRKQEA